METKIIKSLINDALENYNMASNFRKGDIFDSKVVLTLSLEEGKVINENNIKVDSLMIVLTRGESRFPILVVPKSSHDAKYAYRQMMKNLLVNSIHQAVSNAINFLSDVHEKRPGDIEPKGEDKYNN